MKRTVAVVIVVLALLAGGAWTLRGRAPSSSAPAAAPAATLEFAATDLLTLEPQRLSRTIPLTGTLRPVDQTVVKTKIPGELRELVVREGSSVTRGQTIGRLDATEYQVRVGERTAQLQAATSQLAQARRTLDNTRQLHAREFISQSALDQVTSAWEVAAGNRDAAEAQLSLARRALGDATLVAPISGIVAERFAQPGEKLPVDGRVLSIVDLSRMEIEAPVPAAEVGSVRIGQQVELGIEGVARRQVGRIVRIAPATQAGTRSVPVYIALENRDPAVRAGLFAQGRLAVESRDAVLAVPQSAIRDVGARLFVYAIVDGRLVEREIRTGMRDESGDRTRIEVLEGLSPGDRIVASNLGALRVGSAVRILPATGTGTDAAAAASPVAAGSPSPSAAPARAAP